MAKKELCPPMGKNGLYEVTVHGPDDEGGDSEEFDIQVWAGDGMEAAMKALNVGFKKHKVVYPSALFIEYNGHEISGATVKEKPMPEISTISRDDPDLPAFQKAIHHADVGLLQPLLDATNRALGGFLWALKPDDKARHLADAIRMAEQFTSTAKSVLKAEKRAAE